ncbi:MAG: FAD-dependent oxidoreductase [Elusimicrobiota bacterium]
MGDKRDITIIGGGPAGLTAGLYASRAGMNTLIIEKAQPGGQLWLSEAIENFPGFPDGIPSAELSNRLRSQTEKFGAEFMAGTVKTIITGSDSCRAETEQGTSVESPGIIISTGASMKTLGVSGEKEFTGRGVSYCAVCDGPLFRDKTVAVIGGGNTACEEAVFLAKFASKVYLVHRRPRLRAIKKIREEVENHQVIELLLGKELNEIKGDDFVEQIGFSDGSSIAVAGVFIFVGLEPQTAFLGDIIEMENGFIVTGNDYMTSVGGLFAAGDCRRGSLRQVISACGEGAAAGEAARKYVEKKKGTSYDW